MYQTEQLKDQGFFFFILSSARVFLYSCLCLSLPPRCSDRTPSYCRRYQPADECDVKGLFTTVPPPSIWTIYSASVLVNFLLPRRRRSGSMGKQGKPRDDVLGGRSWLLCSLISESLEYRHIMGMTLFQ